MVIPIQHKNALMLTEHAKSYNHFHGKRDNDYSGEYLERSSQLNIAKHFFELGMQVSGLLTWEDIANINDIVSEILKECKDKILYDTQESFCKEVLNRFRSQKGG